jgi:pimeloyl-ACP methyl ester carboxylesterase
MPYIEASDGTSLFITEWGSGAPVVFTHAWGLRSDQWDYQVPALAEAGLRCVLYDRRGHGRSDWTTRMIVDTPLRVLLETLRLNTDINMTEELRKVGVPTLIVHGDQDASAPLELTGRKTAALIDGAELTVYPEAGHGVYASDHQALNTDIIRFIKNSAA